MILHCNYEELKALSSGIEMMAAGAGAVAAPSESVALAESLLPRLTGDLSIETLEEQRRVQEAVALTCRSLLAHLDAKVVEFHPGHEEAVQLYFDYAYSRVVLERLNVMGTEMEAILGLISGGHPDPNLASTVTFPD